MLNDDKEAMALTNFVEETNEEVDLYVQHVPSQLEVVHFIYDGGVEEIVAEENMVREKEVVVEENVVREEEVVAEENVVLEEEEVAKENVVLEEEEVAEENVVREEEVVTSLLGIYLIKINK